MEKVTKFPEGPQDTMSVQEHPPCLGMDLIRLRGVGDWIDRLVSKRSLPGASVFVAHHGQLIYTRHAGFADIERRVPMSADTIVRIKSMTKPLTSAGIMMLYEEGRFQLDEPISRFVPAFHGQRVYAGGDRDAYRTVPAERDITFRDLLTHTSGLTYGFLRTSVVDQLYRAAGVDFQLDSPNREGPPDATLSAMVERAARMPLLAQPGTAWHYSIATDILAYLIELISGQRYEDFMRTRLFEPLHMTDTSFQVPSTKLARFAAHYAPSVDGLRLLDDRATSRFVQPIPLCSGGGGVVSTGVDYLKFCQMILNGGAVGGKRLLGRKTVELMTGNHLNGSDIASWGTPLINGETSAGTGFGLGFSVLLCPQRAQTIGSPGQIGWWGSASTSFWIDPAEHLAVVFLTQLTPSSAYRLSRELGVLVYRSLT